MRCVGGGKLAAHAQAKGSVATKAIIEFRMMTFSTVSVQQPSRAAWMRHGGAALREGRTTAGSTPFSTARAVERRGARAVAPPGSAGSRRGAVDRHRRYPQMGLAVAGLPILAFFREQEGGTGRGGVVGRGVVGGTLQRKGSPHG